MAQQEVFARKRPAERRSRPRFSYRRDAVLFWNGDPIACEIVDLSDHGAAIVGATLPPAGTKVELKVSPIGRVAARVVYTGDGRAGLEFAFAEGEHAADTPHATLPMLGRRRLAP